MSRRLNVVLIAVLGLCASLLMSPAVALAATTDATISGRITTEGFDLMSLPSEASLKVQALAVVGGRLTVVNSIDTRGTGSGGRIQPDGTYSISVPRPHSEVVLKFIQGHCFFGWGDPCDSGAAPDIPAPDVQESYWDGTTYGDINGISAGETRISVASGSVSGRDITLRKSKKVRPLVRPRIIGDPSPGQVLRAGYGTYEPASDDETFQWLIGDNEYRGEYDRAVDSGHRFRVLPKHLGHTLALVASPKALSHEAPILQTSYLVVRSRSKFGVKARAGKRKATVTIAIKAPGVAKSRIHGKASIYAKGKRIKTVNVRNGEATIKVAKQRKGKRTYTVRYSGNRIITPSAKSLKIKIR